MKKELPLDPATQQAWQVIDKLRRLAEYRGFLEVRPGEIEGLAIDLGYRRSQSDYLNGSEWLASMMATVGFHTAMPQSLLVVCSPPLRYRSGMVVPGSPGPEYVAASVNKLLGNTVFPVGKRNRSRETKTPEASLCP